MTSSSNLKAVLVNSNTEDDKYTKEFESPLSALTHVIDDIKYGTLSAAIKTSLLGPAINRYLTNKAGSSGGNRPYQFSCKSDYTSYDSLTDYSYYGRHVDGMPDEWVNSLPDIDKVLKLFKRPDVLDDKGVKTGELQTMCIRSTMLFPTFAQHLVDSFIVTNFKAQTKNSTAPTEFNWRKTDTPHDIGLLTVYGLTIEETMQLRLQSTTKGKLGRMKTQSINGEDWGPFLFDSNGDKKKEFDAIPYPQGLDHILMYRKPEEIKEIKSKIFAFGGARTNLTPNIVAWNTLLLREHNRIASEIEESEPTWDDERVFQTARNVLLAMYLKLVIEEYINHITKYEVDFVVSPGPWMWNAPWYKRNWISAEFAVLYRWHGVIPNCMKWGDKTFSTKDSLYNNNVLLDDMKGSLRDIFVNISDHRATGMNLFNTESWMVGRDKAALNQSRACNLRPYADYAVYLSGDEKARPTKFSDISKDPKVQDALKEVYGTVDKVEFWTGLLASDNPVENIMSENMTKFVANDAFNQALNHPLLSENVWSKKEQTFGKYGWKLLQKKARIADIVERNTKGGELTGFVGMTNPNARRRGINLLPLAVILIVALVAHLVNLLLD